MQATKETSLKSRIETLRFELNKLTESDTINISKVLKLSVKLDKLIVKYYTR